MGQKMAKKELQKAETYYNDQRFDDAAQSWMKALKQLSNPVEKFHVCGKICNSLCDVGKFRDALTFAGEQCEIANSLNESCLRSEAFFNIAFCNEKSCEFKKAIAYCKDSQQCGTESPPFKGQLFLCHGNAFLGLSEFVKAWNNYVYSMDHAKATGDRLSEFLTSARMGTLFCCLGDYESCIAYCNNALDIVTTFMDDDPVLKFRRQILVWLAVAHRKMGRYAEAMDFCEDAMKTALQMNDRPVQARCLYLFADIHRKKGDVERAHPRYESAYSIMSETGDRLGQVEALGGMAKAAFVQGQFEKALELNKKALDLAFKVGCKLEMLRCHARLKLLHEANGDTELSVSHCNIMGHLVQEMDLFCGICDEIIGQCQERLEPLSCGHFIHARCAIHLARSTLGRSTKRRPCPACRRNESVNPVIQNDINNL